MAQLVGEQPADHLVTRLPAFLCFDQRSRRVDPDERIVRTCGLRVFRLPHDTDIHPAVIAVTLALCRNDIGKVSRKNAGHKKLLVGDAAALLIEQLPDLFMIDSRHRCFCASFLYRLAAFGCELRLQYRGDQRIPVILIGGGFGNDSVQRRGIRVAGDLCG